jgi:predicted alpha/beta-hydrolase family hydrolase
MTGMFLFAPGAGAPSSHPWMRDFSELLGSIGKVETLDYDYMREGRKRPDPLPQLIACHRRALAAARTQHTRPIFLAGKSMGGRVGCHVSVEEEVAGLICFGYPLCAMGDRTKVRDKVLLALTTPILFVQGTRDQLCPLDLLAEVRAKMKAPNVLHVIEGGDHSLRVRAMDLRREQRTQDQIDKCIIDEVARFVRSLS